MVSNVAKHMFYLHDSNVVVPVGNALNNKHFVSKSHYIDSLRDNEFGICSSYTPSFHNNKSLKQLNAEK